MKNLNLLFDLDGTLADPFKAFSLSLKYAFTKLNYPVPSDDKIKQMIGPPMMQSIPEVLGINDEKKALQILETYREHHSETCVQNYEMYEGLKEALEDLGARFRLYVCTSKPWKYARPILEEKNYAHYFRQIYGAELDNTRSDKADLIKHILVTERLHPKDCIMIGDRKHDAIAAHKNGVLTAAVLWGYGSREELQKANTQWTFETVSQLKKWSP
jgi:phosphoglycolate phosphatase